MTLHEALNILEEISLGDKEREAYEKVRDACKEQEAQENS